MADISTPVALVTGSALRLGRHMICKLHQAGYNVIVHYHQSQTAAQSLVAELNQQRANSAAMVSANLTDDTAIAALAQDVLACFGRLDVL
ncbi:SDR family NAD(P)-dependent oxidoreductase, partial [Arsukibacterium sp.]|uniref:SDR family NAD(P)-dependent oxidoreductase n=1 Tax=Arsukibacterium sp. TaxID=1977258 RepID=UPI002FDAC173